MELKTEGVKVFGPADDGTIPGMDVGLADQDTFSFSGTNAVVIGEFPRVLSNHCEASEDESANRILCMLHMNICPLISKYRCRRTHSRSHCILLPRGEVGIRRR